MKNKQISGSKIWDETEYKAYLADGFRKPDWAVESGTDPYGWYAVFRVKGVEQRMRWIRPGRFMMGSPETESGREADDEIQHEVLISKGFWLAETACSQALWAVVMGDNPSRFKGERLPVETVSWDDCKEFIEEVNHSITGLDLRLPTEAEWEYACRAGTDTPFYFGNNITTDQVNYDGNYPYAGDVVGVYRKMTVDVGSLPCNRNGLYEMHGNVWEWCFDWYGKYVDGVFIDSYDVLWGGSRVLRGGCWFSSGRNVRSAFRLRNTPGSRFHDTGFRLARD